MSARETEGPPKLSIKLNRVGGGEKNQLCVVFVLSVFCYNFHCDSDYLERESESRTSHRSHQQQ